MSDSREPRAPTRHEWGKAGAPPCRDCGQPVVNANNLSFPGQRFKSDVCGVCRGRRAARALAASRARRAGGF